MRNVLLLIGVVLRSQIIPRKKWRAISAIWKMIRLAWCPRREPGIVHAVIQLTAGEGLAQLIVQLANGGDVSDVAHDESPMVTDGQGTGLG